MTIHPDAIVTAGDRLASIWLTEAEVRWLHVALGDLVAQYDDEAQPETAAKGEDDRE